jgi:hypothetical protein
VEKRFSIKICHECIIKIVHKLNQHGYMLDEQSPCLSSKMIEFQYREIEHRIRKHGYSGGELYNSAKYYKLHGAVYAIFDSERFDYKTINKIIDIWVNKWPQNKR